MCDLISPELSLENDQIEKQLRLCNPKQLITTLTKHKLYPHFYKVWNKTGIQINDPAWLHFNDTLNQMTDANKMRMLQKTATLITIIKHFEQAGITIIPLKGPVLAQRIYGDIAMKASGDLDLLVKDEYLIQALDAFQKMGFINTYIAKPLTPKQFKYNLTHFQHFSFKSPNTDVVIELHWRVNQLEYLSSFSTADLWRSVSHTELTGGCGVTILQPEKEFIYLLSHGAAHSFHRLQWLFDVTLFWDKYKDEIQMQSASIRNNLALIDTCLGCSNALFSYPVLQSGNTNNRFIEHVFKGLNPNIPATGNIQNYRDNYGLLLLVKGLRKKISILFNQLTSPRDWNTLPLPDALFFLYFILRPFIILWRTIRRQ
jgi:hypothetical protein